VDYDALAWISLNPCRRDNWPYSNWGRIHDLMST